VSPRVRDWSDGSGSERREERLPTPARLYTEAIRALARRELTSQQLRAKLAQVGGRASDIDAVLARLTGEGALDDRRAARIYAQTAFKQRKRARARIQQELEHLGIDAVVAREIVDEVCGGEAERRRLEHAVIFALRGTRRDHRDDDARRIFAHFVRQGYQPDDVKRALVRAGVDASVLDE
jgi:SOS response regulatory protein OraA/RecX